MATNTARARGNINKGVNRTSGYINRSANYLKGVNKVVLLLVGLFVLLVVGIIVYWIYKAIQKSRKGDDENPILVSGSIDASDPANSKSWTLPTSSGSNSPNMAYTISFWIYIADWYYRVDDPKAILIKDVEIGDTVSGYNAAPGIWLAPDKNNLIVATSVLGRKKPQVCDVANIPIQKWVHIAYVLDNRTVDVYVDCKLERSCILSGVPLLNNHKLHLFPQNPSSPGGSGTSDKQTGFLGQLSSLRYFSTALKPVDIASICNSGPNATVGEPTKDHKPKNIDPDGSCSGKVFTDLELVKDQLVNITKEVDDALAQESDQPSRKEPEYGMKWRSLTPPKITRINGGDGGDNVPGQGTGYQCMQPSGICQTGGQLGTQGTFGDIGSCQTNCNATGFGPIGGGGGGLYTGDNMVGGQKKKVFRRRMGQ
jgi:hypothetical protein